jgi:hypothetical protein
MLSAFSRPRKLEAIVRDVGLSLGQLLCLFCRSRAAAHLVLPRSLRGMQMPRSAGGVAAAAAAGSKQHRQNLVCGPSAWPASQTWSCISCCCYYSKLIESTSCNACCIMQQVEHLQVLCRGYLLPASAVCCACTYTAASSTSKVSMLCWLV